MSLHDLFCISLRLEFVISPYRENRGTIDPGRFDSQRDSASRNTVFCSSRMPGLPRLLPILKPFGYKARGGRICAETSGLTVIKTVGIPFISISRWTATTVR